MRIVPEVCHSLPFQSQAGYKTQSLLQVQREARHPRLYPGEYLAGLKKGQDRVRGELTAYHQE